ncbi:MAG: hypothetical protein AAGF11_21700 [Myxococcota bacterium]
MLPPSEQLEREALRRQACGQIARAHAIARADPGSLKAKLETLGGRRAGRARQALRDAERLWARARALDTCPPQLCCPVDEQTACLPLPGSVEPRIPNVEHFWIRLASGLCLEAGDGVVTAAYCEDRLAQRWVTTEGEGLAVIMRSARSQTCIAATGAEDTVDLVPCGTDDALAFERKPSGDYVTLERTRECPPPQEPPRHEDPGVTGPSESAPACEPVQCLGFGSPVEPGARLRLGGCHRGQGQRFELSRARLLSATELSCDEVTLAGRCEPFDMAAQGPALLSLSDGTRAPARACGAAIDRSMCPERSRFIELRTGSAGTIELRCFE